MNILARTAHAIKAAMVFPRGPASWGRFDKLQDPWPRDCNWNWRRAGETYDPIAAAGDVAFNAVVAALGGWVVENIPQARPTVLEEGENGIWAPIPRHPLLELLRSPNGYYSSDELFGSAALDYLIDGNAGWQKIRDKAGTVRELWWIPRHMWRPDSPEDGSTFISRYLYRVNGKDYPIDPNDFVHFRFPRLDPADPRLGISPMRAMLPEVGLDNNITLHNGALVANGAAPGVVISPDMRPEDPPMGEPEAEAIRAKYEQKFGGTNRGRVMVLTFAAKVEKLGYTPEEMRLDVIGHRPEARMCSALRIAPMAIDLSVGEDQRTYANMKEAREKSWEECLIPALQRLANNMTRQLLWEFDKTPNHRVSWDYSDVRALREDEDAKSKRATMEWEADGLTFNEYREKIGQPKLKEGDPRGKMYFSDLKLTKAVETAEAMPAPPESAGDAAANGRRPVPNGR